MPRTAPKRTAISPQPTHMSETPHAAGKPVHTDEQGMERLVFFSDAVFAIAITLLALDIRLPAESAALTNEDLLNMLLGLWPRYLAYLISFLTIGGFWLAHHKKFHVIRRYDARLMILNLLLLMVIAFVPFPTGVISTYGNQTATIFYALTMVLAGLISALMWWYALRGNRLVATDVSPARARQLIGRSLIIPGIFLLSVGLAFIDADLAKYSWLLIALVNLFMR